MIFVHEVVVPIPLSAIRLDDWIFGMTEKEYMACARGHLAMGTAGGAKRKGMVNVESMAGALIIQHYCTQIVQADHVRLFSGASRAYLMHVIPFQLSVSWDMEVSSISPDVSRLRCTIDVRTPWWVRIVGFFNATNFWIKRHLVEETGGFTRDLAAKMAS